MPSTISAGTTAGTAIAVAGDTTGDLAFQTNGTTTAMTINTSQNVGIGTSSPAAKLQVTVSPGAHRLGLNGSDVNYNVRANAGSNASITWTEDGISDRWTVGCVNGQDYLGFRAGSSNMSNGTEQARITAAGLFQFNSGYGSVATAYGCRAWVNFNGTGTVAIRGSGNVSSITDNGTGQYTANLTTAMPDTNGSVTGGGFYFSGLNSNGEAVQCALSTTSAVRINTGSTAAFNDFAIVNVAVFR